MSLRRSVLFGAPVFGQTRVFVQLPRTGCRGDPPQQPCRSRPKDTKNLIVTGAVRWRRTDGWTRQYQRHRRRHYHQQRQKKKRRMREMENNWHLSSLRGGICFFFGDLFFLQKEKFESGRSGRVRADYTKGNRRKPMKKRHFLKRKRELDIFLCEIADPPQPRCYYFKCEWDLTSIIGNCIQDQWRRPNKKSRWKENCFGWIH